MKRLLVLAVLVCCVCFSCQTQQETVSSVAKPISTDEVSVNKPIIDSKQISNEKIQSLSNDSDVSKRNIHVEVETAEGKAKVWTKTFAGQDKRSVRQKLYYQIGSKKPQLVVKTRGYGYFEDISLSPNGKWATAFFYYEEAGAFNDMKTGEHTILINFQNNDFTTWNDINKRLGKADEGKRIYVLGWKANQPATLVYQTLPETPIFVDLPDKMSTSRQSLYQATGYDEKRQS